MTLLRAIEYGSAGKERRCCRVAVAGCADCGTSVCSSCCKECCGKTLCEYCYDYHVIHSCMHERFWVNGTLTGSNRFSPGAPTPC
jgi:hypothetical protein